MQQFNSTYLILPRGYYNEPLKCRQILSHFHQEVNQYDQENGTARKQIYQLKNTVVGYFVRHYSSNSMCK